uniref:Uncharacterized protein n=1 Tax=Arundo donax TaxID=35708 RepID=A0A0A8YJT0_ARUDO
MVSVENVCIEWDVFVTGGDFTLAVSEAGS